MEEQIIEIEKEIARLEAEKAELQKKKRREECERNWRELQSQVENMTAEQIYSFELEETTSTIPVFDHFVKCNKQFLLLKNMFTRGIRRQIHSLLFGMLSGIGSSPCDLIVIKNWSRIFFQPTKITASKLKKRAGYCVNWDELNDVKPHSSLLEELTDELRPLWEELKASIKKFEETEAVDNRIIVFSRPIELRAQTSQNREGYGNQYCGETLVHKGTEYGETTRFLIVGARFHN